MMKNNLNFSSCKIGIFGLSYKENTSDLRNSLSLKLIKICKNLGLNYLVHDPHADKKMVLDKYQVEISELDAMTELTIAIFVVGHHFYLEQGVLNLIERLQPPKILIDIPNAFVSSIKPYQDIAYWSL